ncbi:hypothetical protein CEUSTIGMA_g6529.t1 [Chlamydomonas eustigma]|uniref:Glutaredoxin-dependent peroxiredoxin n=1 Tax=Chlamydomonas eustigma TaxID=1157962 RepID=A0A250X835_9CHLO|nr:hypothetical protein CEUSTIGMA_g6529.t1 [Chlamydomonas eustigma]|eukprot:GAX79089.1 hypothetical protein CEUSTIGMA_g6529.t1 [Chlamydomonas eustigma]
MLLPSDHKMLHQASQKQFCMKSVTRTLHFTRDRRPLQVTQALAVGDKLPSATLKFFNNEGNMKELTTEQLCKGKKLVLFAVPGAFTPTCSLKHLPGFIEKADEIKSKGVDSIVCVSVNDAFVMDAWGKSAGAGDKVMMLADGNAQFTKALGVDLDLTDKGLGVRSRRYAMLVEDQVIKVLNLEEGGAFTVSSADEILEALA